MAQAMSAHRRRRVSSLDSERFEVWLLPEPGREPEVLATARTAGDARFAARTIAGEANLPRRRLAVYDTRLERTLAA